MGFAYSDSFGLIESEHSSYETPDHAFIAYYLMELAIAHANENDALTKLLSAQKRIETLNDTFGYLKEKYPEEFI